MNEQDFFEYFPVRDPGSNKSDNGTILIVGGSYGMAGAGILNILGARSVGTSYIHVSVPQDIYPILAANQITSVYHPRQDGEPLFVSVQSILPKLDAACFGSGCTNLISKTADLQWLTANITSTLVIDAEGLRILADIPNILSTMKCPVILTPHLGEFTGMVKRGFDEVSRNKEELALNYAKEHNVILVLKGPKTLIVSPDGDITYNDSGNESLAQAGSGDVLTGIITGMCAKVSDPYLAACMGVWLHGHLADLWVKDHSRIGLRLEDYPVLADQFFKGKR